MAKALETVLPDFKPTPLQQAAIERIREYKEELRQYGMYARTSMELEFLTEDKDKRPIRCLVDLDKARRHFDSEPRISPYIEKVVPENDLAAMYADMRTAKYEVTAADVMELNPRGLLVGTSPETLAGVIAHIKQDSIRQMLLASTSLHTGRAVPELHPNFSARPYYEPPGDTHLESAKNNVTSSLHINISLSDQQGRNMFGRSKELFTHCANALVEVQREAGLAMMPNENSVTRPPSQSTAPKTIGIQLWKDYSRSDPDIPSICLRNDMLDMQTRQVVNAQDYSRIENKLPGADVDPFVGMAVTMAAMVSAVREHVKKTQVEDRSAVRIEIDTPVKLSGKREPMPDSHDTWVQRMESSTRMRELLGEKLHGAILNEYGKPPGASR